MINIRRFYVYLVSAITLQAVAWATIALLRNLTGRSLLSPTSAIAAQVAMILVGLPLFLVHWLWAQRSAAADKAERASPVRRFYLNAMYLAFIIPAINSIRLIIESVLEKLLRSSPLGRFWSTEILFSLIALLVASVLAAYHYHTRQQDDKLIDRDDTNTVLDQLLIYLLVAGGLTLTVIGVSGLIRLILENSFGSGIRLGRNLTQAETIALVLVGLPLWIISWRQAQLRFATGDPAEQGSLVRKITLYLIVLLSAAAAITTTAILLANFLMRLLNVHTAAGGLYNAIAIIIVSGVTWAYHALVLQRDAAAADSVGQAAAVRRIYLYLVSGIGLTAVLIGTGGILSVLIRAQDNFRLGLDLREQLAWFTATLIAGLPVWLISWRHIQQLVSGDGPSQNEERGAFVRRFYLYLFLFFAMLTLLGGAVYIVSQIVELILGARATRGLFSDLGQAVAYTLIAIAVLIYHGKLLRQDQQAIAGQEILEQQQLTVAIIDIGSGRLGTALIDYLRRELPGINIQPVPLTASAASAMLAAPPEQSPAAILSSAAAILSSAAVIVAPWQLASKAQEGSLDAAVFQALSQTSAHKLILPLPQKGMTWIGVELWQEKAIARDVGIAINSIARGEKPSTPHKLSAAAIAVIVLAALCSLTIFVPLVIQLIDILLRF